MMMMSEEITPAAARRLMRASRVSLSRLMAICREADSVDPVGYFARAVETEREHGRAGALIGTDVARSDRDAARIAIAHLVGVEADKPVARWVPYPHYYHDLWAMEAAHAARVRRRRHH
jgi:hypothetical protein